MFVDKERKTHQDFCPMLNHKESLGKPQYNTATPRFFHYAAS